MDRSVVLSLAGLLLILAVLVNTLYFNEIYKAWNVDTTASLVNNGVGSIRNIIKPPETRVVAYQGKNIIVLDNVSQNEQDALLTEARFRNALESSDRLLLYTSNNGLSAVVASNYFNDAEVQMLSMNENVTKALEGPNALGVVNLSVDVSDPTNAKVEVIELGGEWFSLLIDHQVSKENVSLMESSAEFEKVLQDSEKISNKTLVLYHPSNGNWNVIIPVKFNDYETQLLTKNSAVKTALETIDIKNGETLDLGKTEEFSQIGISQLPYNPNTRIYASFNIMGELGFLSQDMLIYLAVFVVVLVMFYVLYTILVV